MIAYISRDHESIPLPSYATEGSVAFDLASSEDITIAPHAMTLIPTGLVIATPKGYALVLVARSSLFKKKGLMLANSIGIIDQDYCGPNDKIMIAVWNTTNASVDVAKGERLAQGLFLPVEKAEWKEGLTSTDDRGGFGSTG